MVDFALEIQKKRSTWDRDAQQLQKIERGGELDGDGNSDQE
jgi:hypothetical protein